MKIEEHLTMTEQPIKTESKLTSVMVAHFAVMITLLGYAIVASNPTARSVNAYYGNLIPASSVFYDGILPYLCIVGIIIIAVFAKKYPFIALLIATSPVVIYTLSSVGWVLGTYGTDNPTNPVAAFTHISVTCLIYAIAWMGANDATRTS